MGGIGGGAFGGMVDKLQYVRVLKTNLHLWRP